MAFGVELLTGTVASLLADMLMIGTRKITRLGIPTPFYLYRRELETKLREMPFIYRDLSAEVLSDYVEVEIGTLDPQTTQRTTPAAVEQELSMRMRHRRKVLLLGSAGVGKTTYFRYLILNMLRRTWPEFFFPEEDVVPFYVPLKAVANAAPSPIVRYLLDNNAYLASRSSRGPIRLQRLAQKNRLILFLDGYDEIYMDLGGSNGQNYIREELATLLGRRPPSLPGCDARLNHVYYALTNARVWLTSRREFYVDHPIDLSRVLGQHVDCVGLALVGLGNSRYQLASKIFDKYRSRAATYHDLLSEELFLTQIDRSAHSDIAELSNNPLFLTVMCYVYVHRLSSRGVDGDWVLDTFDLVEECIRLLLRDIDETKARGLPPAQRAALVKRRNDFQQEKERFLPFFAWRSLEQRRGVFELSYVNEQAREFFSAENSAQNERLMRNLSIGQPVKDTIAHQLANQGVFVIVERSDTRVTYDFAHRRFREVLAARYIDAEWTLKDIGEVLDRDDLAEFVFVLMRLSSSRNEIFQRIIDLAIRSPERESLGKLVTRCGLLEIRDFRRRELVEQFLLRCLAAGIAPKVPNELLRVPHPSVATIIRISEYFKDGLQQGIRQQLTLAGELLRIHDLSLLNDLLHKHFASAVLYDNCGADAVALAYKTDRDLILENMSSIAERDATLAALAAVLANHYPRLVVESAFTVKILDQLNARQLAVALWQMITYDGSAVASVVPRLKLREADAIAHLIRFARSNPDRWKEAKRLIANQVRVFVRPTRGVFFDGDAVKTDSIPTATRAVYPDLEVVAPMIAAHVIAASESQRADHLRRILRDAPTFVE